MHGEGTFYVEGATYSLSGAYHEGEPARSAAKYDVKILSPVEEEEDPKAKKDAKKAPAAAVDEAEGAGNAVKVIIDVCNPDETKKNVSL